MIQEPSPEVTPLVTETEASSEVVGTSSEVVGSTSRVVGMDDNDNHSSEEELEDIIGNSSLKKV